MDRLDRSGEERDLAARRAVQAKVRHSMVRLALKNEMTLPNPNVFETNRKTIGRRFPFVFFMSIGIAPMSLWIWATEWSLEPTQPSSSDINDNELSFSFGQVRFSRSFRWAALN